MIASGWYPSRAWLTVATLYILTSMIEANILIDCTYPGSGEHCLYPLKDITVVKPGEFIVAKLRCLGCPTTTARLEGGRHKITHEQNALVRVLFFTLPHVFAPKTLFASLLTGGIAALQYQPFERPHGTPPKLRPRLSHPLLPSTETLRSPSPRELQPGLSLLYNRMYTSTLQEFRRQMRLHYGCSWWYGPKLRLCCAPFTGNG